MSSSVSLPVTVPSPPSNAILTDAANYETWLAFIQLTLRMYGLEAVIKSGKDPRSASLPAAPKVGTPPGGGDAADMAKYIASLTALQTYHRAIGPTWVQQQTFVVTLLYRSVSPTIASSLNLTDSPHDLFDELQRTYGRPATKNFAAIRCSYEELTLSVEPNPSLLVTQMKAKVAQLEKGGAAFSVPLEQFNRHVYDRMSANSDFDTIRQMYRTQANAGSLVKDVFIQFLDAIQSTYEEKRIDGASSTGALYAHAQGRETPSGDKTKPPAGKPIGTGLGKSNNVHALQPCQHCQEPGHHKLQCIQFRAKCQSNEDWIFTGGAVKFPKKDAFMTKLHALFTEFDVKFASGFSNPNRPGQQKGTYRKPNNAFVAATEDEASYTGGFVALPVGNSVEDDQFAPTMRVEGIAAVFRGFDADDVATPYLPWSSPGIPISSGAPAPFAFDTSGGTVATPTLPVDVEASAVDAFSEEEEVFLPSAWGITKPVVAAWRSEFMYWLPTVMSVMLVLCNVYYK